ncbi:DUF4145 domain-containing protein [Escherichia coli]|uniref:DUF4145 domain-containing protein n=1 Tax=Escherichia coli TaxID=562 RepID=UPI0006682A38|nr:DUF4145 domain-containing protein [Escherichia coli]EGJ8833972.1 DUF4145 domain-containing protein [Salmonella enterica]EGO4308613.1 DUF4145 domain-containing protein [Escherichia coli]EKC8925559.1 DUF4145 domain-containing protein [Escherichia coli]
MRVHKISARFFGSLNVEWPCPACGQKTLIIDSESFYTKSLLESRRAQNEEWFEPYMDEKVFSCMANCSRVNCGEVVVCIGKGGWEEEWDDEMRHVEHFIWYEPMSFIPTLHPFALPGECPEEIAGPITASFSVYLSQPGSAANLIRISVERMLTAIGIPEHNDKQMRIFLHHRIELLDGQYTPYKDTLMAIKFLGNAGSHTYDEVTTGDIEAAFEIMEYIVNDLFSGRKESIDVLTRRLHGKFGNQ